MCLQCCGLRSLFYRHTGVGPPGALIASQCRGADFREEPDDCKELWHLGEVHVADGIPQHVQGVPRRHPQWRCGAGAAPSLNISAGWYQLQNFVTPLSHLCLHSSHQYIALQLYLVMPTFSEADGSLGLQSSNTAVAGPRLLVQAGWHDSSGESGGWGAAAHP